MKFLSRLPKVCYTCLSTLTCIHSLTMQNQSFFKTLMKAFPYSDVLIVEIVHNVRVCNKSSKTYCFNTMILVEVSSLQLHSKKSTLY